MLKECPFETKSRQNVDDHDQWPCRQKSSLRKCIFVIAIRSPKARWQMIIDMLESNQSWRKLLLSIHLWNSSQFQTINLLRNWSPWSTVIKIHGFLSQTSQIKDSSINLIWLRNFRKIKNFSDSLDSHGKFNLLFVQTYIV